MDLSDIRGEFAKLHVDVGQLMGEVLRARPGAALVVRRKALHNLESRLDEHLRRFVALDAELVRHANPPADINSALRASAQFGLHVAVRDSVRGLIADTYGALASLRNQLDFRGSLTISMLALLVALIALFV